MKPCGPELLALLKTRQCYTADLYSITFSNVVQAPIPPVLPALHRAAYSENGTRTQLSVPPTGIGSTPRGIFSIWTRNIEKFPASGLDRASYNVGAHIQMYMYLYDNTFGQSITLGQNAGTVKMQIEDGVSGGAFFSSNFSTDEIDTDDGTWHHFIVSWDISTGPPYAKVHFFVDGVNRRDLAADGYATSPPTTINWAPPNFSHIGFFGHFDLSSSFTSGCVAEMYFAPGQYLDLTVPSNLARFYNAGHPANLGSDGSTPTGAVPSVYNSGPSSDYFGHAPHVGPFYLDNRGNGGTLLMQAIGTGFFSIENLYFPYPGITIDGVSVFSGALTAPLDPF